MRKQIAAAIVAAACTISADAHAQLLGSVVGKAMGMPEMGEAGGAYQKNNQIRTFITARPYSGIDLYAEVVIKAAEMTRAKGFPLFGVTKSKCTTALMGSTQIASSCYLIAIMLNEGEQAKPRGKIKVTYYKVDDVEAGTIARPGA
jgi:hypothetical protein